MATYRRFLLYMAGSVSLLMFLVMGINITVDPYDIWHCYQRTGFNKFAIQAEDLDRLIQPINFLEVQPETVFLGNSQVIWGIEASEYTRITGKSAYNLGMLGASIYEIRRTLEHAVAVDKNIKEVYVCVNFDLFAANDRHPLVQKKPEFAEEQMGCAFITPDNFAKTTLSFKALQDSWATIKANKANKYDFEYYMPTGRWHDKSIERYCQERKWTFNASMKIMARADYYYEDMALHAPSLEEMQKIVDICRENNLELHVFTLPAHARSMEIYAEAWPVYEDWLRHMVKIVPMACFFGYNEYTTSEAAEGILDASTNPYFWDSHHPKSVLGNKILAELAGQEPFYLGTLVTEDNVEGYLKNLADKMASWEENHPESKEEVRYYMGFSPLEPMLLQGKKPVEGRSVVRLDQGNGTEKVFLNKSQEQPLDLTGEHFTPVEARYMYAVLEDGGGNEYYTMAEPVPSVEIANFMHSKEYERKGFHIQAPLRKMPEGSYELYLLEVAADGKVYKSNSLAEIKID